MASGFADEHFPFLAQVIKESVNVRAGPNTNFEKIDKLEKGSKVVVLGRSYEWYKIQPLPTTKSYIRSDYLNIIKGEGIALVLGDDVNIRCKADSGAASLGEVVKGTLVKVLKEVKADQKTGNIILGQVRGWCVLSPVAGTAVWIHQDFLKEISADVPASLLIQTIKRPLAPSVEGPAVPSGVSSLVSMRGTLKALVNPQAGAHYEIVLDDKSVFYLQDMPQISFFCNTLVDIEGAIVPDPSKKFMHPLLHINKIALVL
jgi:SH3-like domain-containing protein